MNDYVMTDFVTALAKNSCLEKLDVGDPEILLISLNILVSCQYAVQAHDTLVYAQSITSKRKSISTDSILSS